MIRMPPHIDNDWHPVKRTCPGFGKTQAQQAAAIEVYRTPLHKRAIWALCRWGWALVLIGVFALTGCSDIDAEIKMHADLADAIATAAKEAGK